MRIRRYYGFDCDSVMGFNNGRYIDAESIEVKDLNEAETLCLEFIQREYGVSKAAIDIQDQGEHGNFELVTGYYDSNGNELTFQEYEAIDDPDGTKTSYRYVYVNYEVEND